MGNQVHKVYIRAALTSYAGEVKTMELKNKYPMLAGHISASEVITPEGSEVLVYNTLTGIKNRANRATFNFLILATGEKSCDVITAELSRQSGEPPEQIWPGLTTLVTQMVEKGLLTLSDSPFQNLRNPPPSVELVRRLESVSFETTRKCNLRCRHCYSDAGVQLEDELTVEEIKTLIDELADMGLLSITFTGGEPLLHPHLFELMEYAGKKPLTVLFFTNGTLLTPEIVSKLKELHVFRVNVSIDGPDPETHDTFRGLEGAFERTLRGVKLLREAGIPVSASVSVTKTNYKKMRQLLHLIRESGISDYKIWPISFSGRSDEKEIFLTCEEFREVMEASRKFEIEELGKKQKEEFRYSKEAKNCGIGVGALAIKCNGSVVPCPAFDESVSLGNVRTHSVKEIWNNSPLLNRLRALNVFETEICKDCQFAAICKGGCVADIYEKSGKFTCYDEYVCVAFDVTKDDFIPVEVDAGPPTSLFVEFA